LYELTINAICPLDTRQLDKYQAHITTDHMITVESILEKVTLLTSKPTYQEDLTQQLADAFNAHVVTSGTHSQVSVVCTAEPQEA
jgi:GTP cyclohydrolase I